MKELLLLLVVVTFTLNAESKSRFVRLIDKQGNKIAKGRIVNLADSTLVIERNGREIQVPVSKINYIITCRSAGHNILIGTAAGGFIGLMAGGNSEDSDVFNDEQTKYISLAAGAGIGLLLSLLTLPIKPTEYIFIKGDRATLVKFMQEYQK